MSLPSVDELVAVYNQVRGSDVARAEQRLFQQFGIDALVPRLIECYPRVRRASGRAAILFWLPRFAREREDVVQLARLALIDATCQVRSEACSILAYSLRYDMLDDLVPLLDHAHPKTRDDAAAAIDAIGSRNHHYYVDRAHTGATFWGVRAGDVPVKPGKPRLSPTLLLLEAPAA
ncbi:MULTISPECIES: hypothetical protein [Dyella]|uniref:HEAT repeat domain-containing protein n=2 Tax=Dyella TaxID=231454 RepID=A0A4R0YXD8_9GAMM|nr:MULTISPECIES: hypothetical protein [Dyella]TBR40484.1 hypothetical protein EYV96_10115 [Dyella terrae]TCI11934.1 hypothetical protein EZM97_00755 [Dyella soli]